MSHYRSNLRDVEFNLFELFDREQVYGGGVFADIDGDTARHILREVERLARERLAASWVESDRDPPVYDPVNHSVRMPIEFAKAYATWTDTGWWQLPLPPALGGRNGPPSLAWASAEFVLGANPALWVYASAATVSRVLHENGNDRDRAISQHLLQRRWTATMVLTEPDAGSDVGSVRTKVFPDEDGMWRIVGTKRFITAADHDMAENILHLVLARPSGVPGAGGPGTKGLSLFLVPKFAFDPRTGELTGARNGAYVTGIERKMGMHASVTCEMSFSDPSAGGGEPARGWLLGDVHDGIDQMFRVIENTRMMVGAKAISTLSTGYLNALAYAKQRVQGADLTRAADPTAPRVSIMHHPDVRRSLLVQKSYAEGLRSLLLYTATWQDEILRRQAAGEDAADAAAVNDLLLPVVKGYGSERSWVVLGTESLQTFGGSGYLLDFPLEQYVRDAKIDTLYEGTTAIQGQDLFFRKIARDRGKALGTLLERIRVDVAVGLESTELAPDRALLAAGADHVEAIATAMLADLASAKQEDDGKSVYKVGLNARRLLFALGDVMLSWLLLRGATVALRRLDGDVAASDAAFYRGKVTTATFFAQTVLPRLAGERESAISVDLSPMDLAEASF